MEATNVAVPVPCPCEGKPHPDGDSVYLRPKLGLAAGIEIQRLMVESNTDRADYAAVAGKLAESYLRLGVVGWTFTVPFNNDTLQSVLLEDFTLSAPVADAADELYMGPVLLPLVQKAARSSSTTTTNGSTSRTRTGSKSRPKRSKPSSTSTTPMGSTGTTTR